MIKSPRKTKNVKKMEKSPINQQSIERSHAAGENLFKSAMRQAAGGKKQRGPPYLIIKDN